MSTLGKDVIVLRKSQCFILFVSVALAAILPSEAIGEDGGIVVETRCLRMAVSKDGKVTELRDKRKGKSYLPEAASLPFMRLRTESKTYNISSLTQSNGLLVASFGNSGITAKLKLDAKDEFLTVEVASVSSTDFKYLEFVRLPIAITETVAWRLNAAYDSDFAAGVLAATPTTNAAFLGRFKDYIILGARCWPEVDTKNVKAVVLGCEAKSLLDTIEKIELACGLPHLTFDGVWAKKSREVQKGYLLCNPKGDDVQKAIAYAKRGGIPYIMFLSGSWTTSMGHYPINTKNFPRGEADLKATVDKIHAEGMKAGMHFLSACISKRDAYVTPVPDKRLDKDGELTLAQDIDEKADIVPTTDDPKGFLTYAYYATQGGVDIQIDDEIIRYAGVSHEPPYGFTQCQRGAYKTKRVPHKAGAKVYHITERYNMFLADPKTDLVDEIAERLTHIYNTCGFDMVYFDGGEAMAATGPGWYTVSLIHRAFYKRAKREILWQGSGSTHYSWHFFSRGNCNDYVCLDPKAYCDQHKTVRIERAYNPSFIAAELGWWGYTTHTASYYATTPDDIIYMCAKAVGWNAAVNLECHMEALDKNGRTGETLDRMNVWQDLQHSDYFSGAIKEKLREREMDFVLVKDDQAKWRVQPVKYHPVHIVDPRRGDTKSWKIDNVMPAGPIAGRIRAMTELAPYGADENIVLFDPKTKEDISLTKAAAGVTVEADISTEQVKTGQASCKLTVTCGKKARRVWAMMGREFEKRLNLSLHRHLGAWVHGDGKGAVVNIQIEDAGHHLRDHYIDIDFTGWRYFTLDLPETRRVWDYRWPYNQKWPLRHLGYGAVRAMNVYVANVKPGESATVFIGKIEALKETPANLKNPTLAIGDKSITIPVEMKPDEYVEFDTAGKCRHFDPNGHLLGEPKCEKPPVAVTGENTVHLTSETNARAKVTVMVKGKLLE